MSSPTTSWCRSSLGRKYLVAVTGLLSCGFLLTHLLGNFLLVAGRDAFNSYAHKLTSTPLIYAAEAVLGAIFLMHLGLALKLSLENRRARGGQRYAMKKRLGAGENLFSATMPYTGIVILIFLISHLQHFKFGSVYMTEVDGVVMRDLYQTVIEYFQNPWATAWYAVAMGLMAMHLAHGVQSAFQSLGWRSGRIGQWIQCASKLFAIIVPAGFLFISLWCHWQA